MANCHNLFQDFYTQIRLSKDKKKKLITGREAIRKKIRKYFEENKPKEIQPKFGEQGSYKMHTIVTPISTDDKKGEFDLDDGIYFLGDIEDRKTPATYHKWIMEAVEDHTSKQEDKPTCVRVVYAGDYHIDLPIYFFDDESELHPSLAHKTQDWIESDPKEFYEWFNKKAKENDQLRRLVRYMKAWRDYREIKNSSNEMPSGMILSILASEYACYDERDDVAMKDTLIAIRDNLKLCFVCLRPTTPLLEDLFKDYSETKKTYFLEQLDSFCESAEMAINQEVPQYACHKWQKHFGERFCCEGVSEDVEGADKHKKPQKPPKAKSATKNA